MRPHSAIVSLLAALVLALNVICLCPHAARADERSAEAAAPASGGHCGGAHEEPNAPDREPEPRCPHCDEVGARLAQSGAVPGLGAAPELDLAIAPALAPLWIAALERAPRPFAPNCGAIPPSVHLRTIVLRI